MRRSRPAGALSKRRGSTHPSANEQGHPGIPLLPVHPGQTVAAELVARELTAHRAALLMRIPPNRLSQILAGKHGISADTALRLARLLGPSAQFWMALQPQYDLAITEQDHGQTIRAEVPILVTA